MWRAEMPPAAGLSEMPGLIKKATQCLYHRRWLLTRRTVQMSILLAFLVSLPELGRIADGNLSSSVWFHKLHLTDPFILLQSLFAGASIASTALIGGLLVAGFYAIFGGRIYCSWVCPVNMLTDAAYWLRQRFHIKTNLTLSRELRKAVLIVALLLSFIAGTLAWEIINPITLLQRELMWASFSGAMLLFSLFLFDLMVSRRGWCGHLCPVGAFYGLLGKFGRLRISKAATRSCGGSACAACVKACPEPHVLAPVISQQAQTVTSGDCTRCGACLDACPSNALTMKLQLGTSQKFKGITVVTESRK